MRFSCLLCLQTLCEETAPFLCPACFGKIETAKPHAEFVSLFRYNEAIRKLILQVKIEANYRSLACLTHLLVHSDLTRDLCQETQRIVPAPSSLWSRIRGRFDLAWLLSHALSKHTGIKLERAPMALYWQTQKRSKLNRRETVDFSYWREPSTNKDVTVVFDDVVTSGYTLRRTALALGNRHVRYLTLASALPR